MIRGALVRRNGTAKDTVVALFPTGTPPPAHSQHEPRTGFTTEKR